VALRSSTAWFKEVSVAPIGQEDLRINLLDINRLYPLKMADILRYALQCSKVCLGGGVKGEKQQ